MRLPIFATVMETPTPVKLFVLMVTTVLVNKAMYATLDLYQTLLNARVAVVGPLLVFHNIVKSATAGKIVVIHVTVRKIAGIIIVRKWLALTHLPM